MKNVIQPIVLAGLLSTASIQANAAIFDFIDLIDNNNGTITGILGNGGGFAGNPGEAGFQTFDWTVGGLTLTATGTNGGNNAFAYLDSNNAGLGVCGSVTGGNQCSPSSDDNVTVGEILNLGFDKLASIDFNAVVFRDAGHNVFNPMIEVNVDGGGFAALDLTSTLQGNSFAFRTLSQNNQFYINVLSANAVPVPGVLSLIALGLVGFGAIFRRKNG